MPSDHKVEVVISLAVVLLLFGAVTHENSYITVDSNSPTVYAVRTTWWGLRTEESEIRWMQPPGYDYAAWCAQSPSGKWYPYLIDLWEAEGPR